MKAAARHVAIDDLPELESLAEEVRATNEPIVLRRKGKDVARIVPLGPTRRRRPGTKGELSAADREALLSTFGAWADFDADAFLEMIYEARIRGSKPPVEW